MQFHVPLKPLSVNQAWQGRRFKTPAYKQYERDLGLLLPALPAPMSDKLELTVEFFLRNAELFDIDNPMKPLWDVMTKKGIYHDDRQIWAMHAYKEKAAENAMRVTVTPYE